MGMDTNVSVRISNLLNCRLRVFPITFLGLPILGKHISIAYWELLYAKVANRVFPRRGKFLSSGARIILTNRCLSSLPSYTMGMCLLPDGVHAKVDTPRSRFFWDGV